MRNALIPVRGGSSVEQVGRARRALGGGVRLVAMEVDIAGLGCQDVGDNALHRGDLVLHACGLEHQSRKQQRTKESHGKERPAAVLK